MAQPESPVESIVLLHGLGRGPWAMKVLERRLSAAGYEVHNLAYPRRASSMEEIVEAVHAQYVACCSRNGGQVNFVTHSMGGLVVRAYLAEYHPENVGRIVMLAPPNGGSEIVDGLRDWWLFRVLLGPIAPQLARDFPA